MLRSTVMIWAFAACLKALVVPAYFSTDFEVHRHWLALTRKLPPGAWYFDESSQWTLDYPPLFAWFEYSLGALLGPPPPLLAHPVESRLADVSKTLPAPAVAWHRGTVMLSEFLVLGLGVWCFSATWTEEGTSSETPRTREKVFLATALIAFDPNLMVLDHIHFQYNGFLLGVCLLSMAALRAERNVLGALLFAVLLNLKHIFVYAGPLYFVYLLKRYCVLGSAPGRGELESPSLRDAGPASAPAAAEGGGKAAAKAAKAARTQNGSGPGAEARSGAAHAQAHAQAQAQAEDSTAAADAWTARVVRFVTRVARLGAVVIAVFAASFGSVVFGRGAPAGPVAALVQVLRRLFPVDARGLVHAYWAPNFWALYAATDTTLGFVAKRYGGGESTNSTRGLVQGEIQFAVLPRVPPVATVVLTALGMSYFLSLVWRRPHPTIFLHAYACCVLSSFVFGYHVHEKALAMVSVPMALAAVDSALDARIYLLLTWTAQVAFAPLLFEPGLLVYKTSLVFCHAVWAVNALDAYHVKVRWARRISFPGGLPKAFTFWDRVYLWGLAVTYFVYESGVVYLAVGRRLEFLPLMGVSVYCGLGVLRCWWICAQRLLLRIRAVDADADSSMSPAPSFAPAERAFR